MVPVVKDLKLCGHMARLEKNSRNLTSARFTQWHLAKISQVRWRQHFCTRQMLESPALLSCPTVAYAIGQASLRSRSSARYPS